MDAGDLKKARLVMTTKRQYREAIRIARGVQCEAARLLGVSRQAVNQYLENHPDVKELAESFVEEMLDNAEGQIARGVERGSLEYVKLAVRYYGHRRGLIERKEITGEGGAPLISEGTTVDANLALILHSEDGQRFLDLLNDLTIPRLQDPRSQDDKS
jgi:hypothetical protein